MQRKIVSCVLVTSLSFSIGCYNTRTITREQIRPTTKEELRGKFEQFDITVFTKDSLEYKFLKDNYRIQGDTLTGFGVQITSGTDRPFRGSLSFGKITSVKTEEFDLAGTIVAIGLPVLLFGGLIVGTMLSIK